jgi:predicted glycosyltransferase
MRVWVDLTNSPHVLVFRPLIRLLRERGHAVEVTAREYAQTMQLLELHGIEATSVGGHGGASALGKARAEISRVPALRRWAKPRRFDLALAHGSHDLTLTARSLGIESATTFDYEFAWLQHQLGCRAATRVVVPDAIPPERLARYGARKKLRRYPGLKEEYYLADLQPVPVDVPAGKRLVVVRTPPEVSLYHRHGNPLFAEVLERLGRDETVHAVVLPRTDEQRAAIRARGLPSLVVPDRAVDAQSLIAAAAAVVSAGGTMNREAVALGTPVYTTFGGRLGAVDEQLIREGRLRRLGRATDLDLDALPARTERLRRDPNLVLDLLLGERS